MKKLIFAVIVSLLLISCTTTRMFYVMQKDYTNYDSAMIDVYSSLRSIQVDSININDWIKNPGLIGEDVVFNQYILLSDQDKNKTHYYMIFTEFYKAVLDSTYYNYKIRCETKNKKIWPGF